MSASSVARSPLRPMVPASGWLATCVPRRSISSSGLAPRKPSTLKTMHVGYRASSLDRTSEDDERAIGRHVDLAGQDDLAQGSVVDAGDSAGHEAPQASWSMTDVRVNWLGAGRGAAEPAEGIGDHLVGQAGRRPGGPPARGDGGDPCFAVVAPDHHARDDERPRCAPHERQRSESYRPGSRPGHVIAAVDGGQAPGHVSHRRGIGETAGKLDAQGYAPPGQPEVLVLPQDPLASRGGDEAEVCSVEAGSLAGQPRCRSHEMV